jgi:hypothetical protein
MSPKLSALVLLVAASGPSLACHAARRTRGSVNLARSCYASPEGQEVRSTLVRMPVPTWGGERFVGLTELGSGERLVEEATIDGSGQLVEARATLTAAGKGGETRVALYPGRGFAELTTPALHLEWSVPNDLPWVWAPLLTASATGKRGSIATPLEGLVTFHAAAMGRPVRLLDLGTLAHHTVTADQIVIPDGNQATVVLADDVIDIDDGTPRRVHLSALDGTLELLDARAPASVLVAALRCTGLSGSFTP